MAHNSISRSYLIMLAADAVEDFLEGRRSFLTWVEIEKAEETEQQLTDILKELSRVIQGGSSPDQHSPDGRRILDKWRKFDQVMDRDKDKQMDKLILAIVIGDACRDHADLRAYLAGKQLQQNEQAARNDFQQLLTLANRVSRLNVNTPNEDADVDKQSQDMRGLMAKLSIAMPSTQADEADEEVLQRSMAMMARAAESMDISGDEVQEETAPVAKIPKDKPDVVEDEYGRKLHLGNDTKYSVSKLWLLQLLHAEIGPFEHGLWTHTGAKDRGEKFEPSHWYVADEAIHPIPLQCEHHYRGTCAEVDNLVCGHACCGAVSKCHGWLPDEARRELELRRLVAELGQG